MNDMKQIKLISKGCAALEKNNLEKALEYFKKAYTDNGSYNAFIMYLISQIFNKLQIWVEEFHALCGAVRFLQLPNNKISKNFEYQIFGQLGQVCLKLGLNQYAATNFYKAYQGCDNINSQVPIFHSYIYSLVTMDNKPEKILASMKEYKALVHQAEKKQYIEQNFTTKRNNEKIHIAYISPDFCNHVMYKFYYALLKLYDRKQFYVSCIMVRDRRDKETEQISQLVDNFLDLSKMDRKDMLEAIRGLSVDILVDLAGLSAFSALPAFVHRIAPVQISGIGWMETTGLDEVDYLITDRYLDSEEASYIVEKPLYLTSSFCYYPNWKIAASDGTPCLKKGYVTFGIFNRVNKYTDSMIATWGKILDLVPNSVLLLNCRDFINAKDRDFVLGRMNQNGISEQRIVIDSAHATAYMERYRDVDIALDTYPYAGCSTTFDALYMGVPVITLYGKRRSSRLGLSVLNNAGVGELAVATADEYVERAVALANDWELLEILHKNLRTMLENSIAMDGRRYVREMEAQYKQVLAKAGSQMTS